MVFDREEYLKSKLNNFLVEKLGLPKDNYYSKLSLENIIGLKSVLSDINNSITLKLSLSFCDWLVENGIISMVTKEHMIRNIKNTKPNANGYDINYSCDELKIIAEVKCNIPINKGNKFGANQKERILKDINGLFNGKSKSGISPDDYLKYFIIYDTPSVRLAMDALKSTNKGTNWDSVLFDFNENKSTEVVRVVFLKAD